MRPTRVSAETLRRLAALEKPKVVQRGGVLVVPKTMSIDEWERVARAAQQKLIEDVRR